MLAACRGRWRGRDVLFIILKNNFWWICHSGFGKVSRSDVCTLYCPQNVRPNFICLSESRSAAQLALRVYNPNPYKFEKVYFWTNFCSWRKRVKEYEMLTRALLRSDPTVNSCYATRHLHGMKPPESGWKRRGTNGGNDFVLLVSNGFGVKPKKKKTRHRSFRDSSRQI